MDNRRFQFMDRRQDRGIYIDRRQDMGMPKVPFKDSNGATIRADRRKISNRRLDDIKLEWSDICSM
jgi:hypothetical protein